MFKRMTSYGSIVAVLTAALFVINTSKSRSDYEAPDYIPEMTCADLSYAVNLYGSKSTRALIAERVVVEQAFAEQGHHELSRDMAEEYLALLWCAGRCENLDTTFHEEIGQEKELWTIVLDSDTTEEIISKFQEFNLPREFALSYVEMRNAVGEDSIRNRLNEIGESLDAYVDFILEDDFYRLAIKKYIIEKAVIPQRYAKDEVQQSEIKYSSAAMYHIWIDSHEEYEELRDMYVKMPVSDFASVVRLSKRSSEYGLAVFRNSDDGYLRLCYEDTANRIIIENCEIAALNCNGRRFQITSVINCSKPAHVAEPRSDSYYHSESYQEEIIADYMKTVDEWNSFLETGAERLGISAYMDRKFAECGIE